MIVILVAFYAGTKFGPGGSTAVTANNSNPRNFTMGSSTARGARGVFGGGVSGQILSLDATTLTMTTQGGGSRIVFLSASTTVNKISAGKINDLTVGANVSVVGSSNTDNSINAQMVQLRPF